MLRMLGLASGYPRTIVESENGAIVEIFEWESEEASRRAHDHPEVKKIWDQIDKAAQFVPLGMLTETQKPFAHFRQVANDRTNRVIHFEIQADNPAKICDFYNDVFGWEFNQWGENQYWLADTGREPSPGINGGVLPREYPNRGVTNTIAVGSIEHAIKKVEKAGGTIRVPKTAIDGVGYVAYASDPESNVFGMLQMDKTAKS